MSEQTPAQPVSAQPTPAKVEQPINQSTGQKPAPIDTKAPAQAPTPEAAPQPDNDISKRIAILARREKETQEQMKQAKAQLEAERQKMLAEVEAKKAELSPYEKWKDYDSKIKNRDWSVLKELGFDYNDYTKSLLNNGEETVETKLARMEQKFDQKLQESIQAKVRELEEINQQRTQEQASHATTVRRKEIAEELQQDFKSEDSKFKWLSFQEAPEDVVDEILIEYYNRTAKEEGRPRVLKYSEAADIAERYFKAEAQKRFGSYEKANAMLKALFDVKDEPVVAPPKDALMKFNVTPKTLTNETNVPPAKPETLTSFDLQKSKEAASKILKWS